MFARVPLASWLVGVFSVQFLMLAVVVVMLFVLYPRSGLGRVTGKVTRSLLWPIEMVLGMSLPLTYHHTTTYRTAGGGGGGVSGRRRGSGRGFARRPWSMRRRRRLLAQLRPRPAPVLRQHTNMELQYAGMLASAGE